MLRPLLPLLTALLLPLPAPVQAAYADATVSTTPVTVPMVFPVVGPVSYSDTFLACRSGCARRHFGQDLMGRRMQPLVAVFDGYVGSIKREATVGEGNYVTLRGDNGWSANYLHVNNDTPGTDDGRGTASYAFAPGLAAGSRVFAGQLLGWLGDSGNAEGTAPHLHFELRKGDAWSGTVYNPFLSLNAAGRLAAPWTSGPHPDGTFVSRARTGAPVFRVAGRTRQRVHPAVLAALGFTPAQVVVVTPNEERWYRPLAAVRLPDGLVYRGPDAALWLVTRGVRIPVPPGGLAGIKVPAAQVRSADAGSISVTPRAPAGTPLPGPLHEGAVLRESGRTEIWMVSGGVRRRIPDWYTLVRLGRRSADIKPVPAGFFDPVTSPDDPAVVVTPGVPMGRTMLLPDGVQLLDYLNRRWVVTKGTRRHVTAEVARLFGWDRVAATRPPAAVIGRIPTGLRLP